jgi:hypothetical protein
MAVNGVFKRKSMKKKSMTIRMFAFAVYLGALLMLTAPAYTQSLNGLSSDDRNSIELACVIAKGDGPATYHACLNQQLRQLGGGQAPSLNGLSSDDRNSIELACVIAKGDGPATYHACLNRQLAALSNLPASTTLIGITPSVASSTASKLAPSPATPAASPLCAENGSCYGDISDKTGLPKTVSVQGYYRKDGTYVRGYYRSK